MKRKENAIENNDNPNRLIKLINSYEIWSKIEKNKWSSPKILDIRIIKVFIIFASKFHDIDKFLKDPKTYSKKNRKIWIVTDLIRTDS